MVETPAEKEARQTRISKAFREAIQQNRVHWQKPGDDSMVGAWGRMVISGYYLTTLGMKWKVGMVDGVDGAYIIHCQCPKFEYVDIFEDDQEFEFFDKTHEVSINPDEISLYLLERHYPDLPKEIMRRLQHVLKHMMGREPKN